MKSTDVEHSEIDEDVLESKLQEASDILFELAPQVQRKKVPGYGIVTIQTSDKSHPKDYYNIRILLETENPAPDDEYGGVIYEYDTFVFWTYHSAPKRPQGKRMYTAYKNPATLECITGLARALQKQLVLELLSENDPEIEQLIEETHLMSAVAEA